VVVQAKRPDAWHKHEQLMLMEKQKPKRKFLLNDRLLAVTDIDGVIKTFICNLYS
jgi:hypothetical protein